MRANKELENRVEEITKLYQKCKRENEKLKKKYEETKNELSNYKLKINGLNNNFEKFKFNCEKHNNKSFNYYCSDCKANLCENCIEEHNLHEIIPFFLIGINNNELNQLDILFEEIHKNLELINNTINDIKDLFFNKIIPIKANYNNIFENDIKNNYKLYFIDYLRTINEKIKIKKYIPTIDLNEKYIICTYNIKQIEKPSQILNNYDEVKNNIQRLMVKEMKKK